MKIENTAQIEAGSNLVMIVYGKGGCGKTTFAASAPNPLILDFENGVKYLGSRGISCDVVRFSAWLTNEEKKELSQILLKYDTIIVDPLGEAMEKLLISPGLNGNKFRQADGSLTMAGWGEAKKQMRNFVKFLRDSGKNVILVSHVAEKKDGDNLIYRIQIPTKLADEIPTMVDVISYMGIKNVEGEAVRMLYTPAQGGPFDSKDRTGRVPPYVIIREKTGWTNLMAAMDISEPKNGMPDNNTSGVSAAFDGAKEQHEKQQSVKVCVPQATDTAESRQKTRTEEECEFLGELLNTQVDGLNISSVKDVEHYKDIIGRNPYKVGACITDVRQKITQFRAEHEAEKAQVPLDIF